MFSKIHVRTGLFMFRFIEHMEEEQTDRVWTHDQQLAPVPRQLSLYDENGFFNVSPAPLMDGASAGAAPTPTQTPRPKAAVTPTHTPRSTAAKAEEGGVDAQPAGEPAARPSSAASRGAPVGQRSQLAKQQPAAHTKPGAPQIKKDPEASPDSDSKHAQRIAESNLQKLVTRVNNVGAQANEIDNLVKTDEGWQWLAGTPAIKDFTNEKKKFESAKASSNFVKSLILNGCDLGPTSNVSVCAVLLLLPLLHRSVVNP